MLFLLFLLLLWLVATQSAITKAKKKKGPSSVFGIASRIFCCRIKLKHILHSLKKYIIMASDSAAARHSPPVDDDVASSVPSSLYARCVTSMSATSLSTKRLQVAVDADLQFLRNRLAKLHLEEERAKNDIVQLRKKTVEISEAKTKHHETSAVRKALSVQVDYGRRKEAALIALNKERQAKAVWASKQKIMVDRREAVANMRKQKEINECRVKILEEEMRDKAVRQRESIRQLHESAKQKRDALEAQRREEARASHEAKLEEMAKEREEKERLAAEFIAQEAQMIYRLKLLHQEKQRQLEKLSLVVEQGPEALAAADEAERHDTSSPSATQETQQQRSPSPQ